MTGGLGRSLLAPELVYGSDDETIASIIRNGLPEGGMPPFASILANDDVRALVVYIREMRHLARDRPPSEPKDGVFTSSEHTFSTETVAETNGEVWSIAFLPDGRLLVTEKEGNLRVLEKSGVISKRIEGTPDVWDYFQGGLLDVVIHPEFERNGWIYLSLSEPSPWGGDKGGPSGMITIVRGRIRGHRWVDQEVIWKAPLRMYTSGRQHFGSRIVLKDGYVFFSIGDRGNMDRAQDISSAMGKTFRLHDDGRIPDDNPFIGRKDALPEIWSYGHRNPQGLDIHPISGDLWSTEHGPRGGDELNLIRPGGNFGWPVITHGMNYDGSPLTARTEKEGMEQPALNWTPSIAVSSISFYRGNAFPNWKNDLFVASLAAEELHRVRLNGSQVITDEVLLKGHGRIRNVESGPDGAIWLALNLTAGSSRIIRLAPIESGGR